jgi:hypothetical protein
LVLSCIYGCLRFLVGVLVLKLYSSDREVEVLVLRHELSVLRRSVKKPKLKPADRMILAALARWLPQRAWGGLSVRPETVLGWHRALVRRKWAAFGRRRGPGRPRLDDECRQLILRLAKENPLCFGVTEHPNQEWVSQQVRNLTWELQEQGSPARFVICDNDKKFSIRLRGRAGRRGCDGDPYTSTGSEGQRPCRALGGKRPSRVLGFG